MTPFWQTLIAAALCLLAAGYLSLRAYRTLLKRSTTSCGGGCKSCSSAGESSGAKIKTLLPLDSPSPSGRAPG